MEYDHTLLSKGRYRIVTVIEKQENDEDRIIGYAVLASSGSRLRYGLTLDDAKAWMEKLIRDEEPERDPAPAQPRPKRVR